MPNIIEQQDLLKGLPDARLAMLLQNPVADIPPFLVAAEAQRRQAIRQQFEGVGSKESVVDSLTKQLAKVPQNIQVPAQSPRKIPPTPQMQGVAALQQQQAIQDAAQQQQQQQQQMRRGGIVQRYQSAGQVLGLDDRIKSIAEQFGISVGEAAEMLKRDPNIGAGGSEEKMGVSPVIPETNMEPRAEPSALDLPGITTSREELAKKQRERFREAKYREMDSYPGYTGNSPLLAQPDMGSMTDEEVMRDLEAQKRRLNKSAAGIPPEETKPKEGETPDEFRARLAELVKAQEPSNFDRAQRWFSMAEQFLDPSKTTMQSVAGAGRAFTEQSAALEKAKREAQLAEKKALLEYDISKRDTDIETARDQRLAQIESIKYQGEQARLEAELFRKAADDAAAALREYDKNNFMASPESAANDPVRADLLKKVEEANRAMSTAIARSSLYQRKYGELLGTYANFGTWDGEKIVR